MPSALIQEPSAAVLRRQAEERLGREPTATGGMSAEQVQALVHELRVHQIELEMQNEHLRTTQQELESARERYFELYDVAPVGYVTLNDEGLITEANLTSVTLLETERGELIGQRLSRFVLSPDQDTYYLCWRQILESDEPNVCEVRLCPPTGRTFYARLEGFKVCQAGSIVCRLTISDITPQKRAEAAVRESEKRRLQYENAEQMRLALEAGELGALDHDLQTGRIMCSERACTMLGFSSNESITWQSIVERIHFEDRSRFLEEVQPKTQSDGHSHFETTFRVTLPGGSLRCLRFVGQCSFAGGGSGKLIRRAGILADITSQTEAQELLHSEAKRLEMLIRERTARLEEVVGELEHFSYTLVHDLRAPLRAMQGFSDLLLAECVSLSPIHRSHLERINSSAARMDRLIVDALDYSKVVRGNFNLAPVDCTALLKEMLDSYPQFASSKASITIEGAIPPVLGNQALLTQCFSNLLINATKFVAPGQVPNVRISAEDKEERVRIWFRDNGIGIPAASQERVFHMFERLSSKYEGTGIGLALVRKAAERMRGSVGVESKPGQGSRFWLEFKKANR